MKAERRASTERERRAFTAVCAAAGFSPPEFEYRFHPDRQWRLDIAWPASKVALEINGGIWTQGRHTRGAGALEDMHKLSEASVLGWRVLYCTPDELYSPTTLDRLRRALLPPEMRRFATLT